MGTSTMVVLFPATPPAQCLSTTGLRPRSRVSPDRTIAFVSATVSSLSMPRVYMAATHEASSTSLSLFSIISPITISMSLESIGAPSSFLRITPIECGTATCFISTSAPSCACRSLLVSANRPTSFGPTTSSLRSTVTTFSRPPSLRTARSPVKIPFLLACLSLSTAMNFPASMSKHLAFAR